MAMAAIWWGLKKQRRLRYLVPYDVLEEDELVGGGEGGEGGEKEGYEGEEGEAGEVGVEGRVSGVDGEGSLRREGNGRRARPNPKTTPPPAG